MSKYNELVKKLKEIFQIDRPELDFGIYRILNAKADEINNYLENTLKQKISDALATAGNANKEELEKQLNSAIKAAEDAGFNPEDSPKVKDLRLQIIATSQGANEHENAVFTHLLSFFSRYYDSGDFVSKRRYKGDTYAIPYAGEEVMLHWANKDQYYIKSGENFANYTFKLEDGRKVSFKLLAADTAKDNRKDNEVARRFVLIEPHNREFKDDKGNEHDKAVIPVYADNEHELIIQFEYKVFNKKEAPIQSESLNNRKKGKFGLNELALAEIAKYVPDEWNLIFQKIPTESNPERTVLEKHLSIYTQRNNADYFIHKDLHGFLCSELDFYIKNEVMNLDNVQNAEVFADIEKQLRMIQCFRDISTDIVLFLSQLENFQKKLWLKRKFVVDSQFLISLSRIKNELLPIIDKNIKQKKRWIDLYALKVKIEDINVEFMRNNGSLVVDTGLFSKDEANSIICSFENIDDEILGHVICSENSNALRLLKRKFEGKIDSVITDPPYNTEDDEFLYKDNYSHSTWATMMSERLACLKSYLKDTSWISLNINDREQHRLISILEQLDLLPASTVSVKMSHLSGTKMSHADRKPPKIKETILLSSMTDKARVNPVYEKSSWWDAFDRYTSFLVKNNSENPNDWTKTSLRQAAIEAGVDVKNLSQYEEFCIENAHLIYQRAKNDSLSHLPKDGKFKRIQTPTGLEKIVLDSKEVLFTSNYLKELNGKLVPTQIKGDIWDDIGINNSHNEGGISFNNGKKPVKLFERLVEMLNPADAFVLDIFGGSGTLAHAIFNANSRKGSKKFIIMEMAAYFDDVLKKRIENNLYRSEWLAGKPIENSQSTEAIIKYVKLESYEDTLNNLEMKTTQTTDDLFDTLPEKVKSDYLLNYMLETESKGSLLSTDDFKKPFDYKMKIAVDSAGASEEQNIDLVETFNYLIGLHVKTIESNLDKGYVRIEGTLPSGERALVLWRDCEKIQYDDFTKFANRFDLFAKQKTFDVIYVNGDHNLPTAFTNDEDDVTRTLKLRQIEPEFLEQMFAPDELV